MTKTGPAHKITDSASLAGEIECQKHKDDHLDPTSSSTAQLRPKVMIIAAISLYASRPTLYSYRSAMRIDRTH